MSNFNALPSLPLTHHAAYPRQQRGIPLKAIHACLDYGRLIHPGSGVEAYFLGRREILAIRKIDPVLSKELWRFQGVQIITSLNATRVVTVYRSGRPIRSK